MDNQVGQQNAASVLIVDDHPVVRRGLSQLLGDHPEFSICGEAATVTEALAAIEQTSPDLVLVDISLADGSNGIELIKEAKSRFPDLRMLVSSMHDESVYAERAIRAGALGYINKNEPTEALLSAVRRVLAGEIHLSSRMTNRVLSRMQAGDQTPSQSPIERLSDRELEVFEMIGGGMTTRQIAAKLELSPKTVETYRENIKAKLDLRNAAELTRHAVQWVLEQS